MKLFNSYTGPTADSHCSLSKRRFTFAAVALVLCALLVAICFAFAGIKAVDAASTYFVQPHVSQGNNKFCCGLNGYDYPKVACDNNNIYVTTRGNNNANTRIASQVWFRTYGSSFWYVAKGWAYIGPRNGFSNLHWYQDANGNNTTTWNQGGVKFTLPQYGYSEVWVKEYEYRGGKWQLLHWNGPRYC